MRPLATGVFAGQEVNGQRGIIGIVAPQARRQGCQDQVDVPAGQRQAVGAGEHLVHHHPAIADGQTQVLGKGRRHDDQGQAVASTRREGFAGGQRVAAVVGQAQ